MQKSVKPKLGFGILIKLENIQIMNIDKKLTEILKSTLVIENKKGIPFAVAKIKELIVMNQSKEETAKDLPDNECPHCQITPVMCKCCGERL
jgi:hypothetical protein